VLNQLSAQLFRGQSRVQPPRPKLRVCLTESLGDILNIREQLRQMLLGTQSASGAKGVATGDARLQFVHPFANRDAVPPELLLSPPLSAASQGAHGRAMNSRRWTPRNVFPVSTMLLVNPSVSSMSLLLQLGRSNIPVTAEIWDTYLFPGPLAPDALVVLPIAQILAEDAHLEKAQ